MSPITIQRTLGGIDVSHWNHGVDWNLAREKFVEFAFIKASEGKNFRDRSFAAAWQGSRKAGILRGAYHFYRNEQPGEQAKFFYQTVAEEGLAGMLPPAVDVEVSHYSPALLHEFLIDVEQLFGVRPLIYTSVYHWPARAPVWTSQYGLWVAHWGVRQPKLPPGWKKWTFWQTSNRANGHEFGVGSARVDTNLFNGSRAELEALCVKSVVPEPDEDGEKLPEPGSIFLPTLGERPVVIKVNNPRVQLRHAPWGSIIGQAYLGSHWEVLDIITDANGRPWYRVASRAVMAGWLCDVLESN